MDDVKKNLRHQLHPSITGKNHITDKDRTTTKNTLPLRICKYLHYHEEWEDLASSVTRTFSEIMSGHKPFVIR